VKQDLNLDYIKGRRGELGITLKEMALELGFRSASTYKKYEDGIYTFKAKHLPVLAKKLQCQLSELYLSCRSVSNNETDPKLR
jgi:transcriptional regulator with XRE-family HTH domain